MQAALDLLADLMTSSRECLREGLVLLVRLTFALEPQQEFKWRAQPEAIIRHASPFPCADTEAGQIEQQLGMFVLIKRDPKILHPVTLWKCRIRCCDSLKMIYTNGSLLPPQML